VKNRLHPGHHSHASSAQDGPYPEFGKRPSVGQSRPYDASNAHRKAEKPTRSNLTAGDGPASGPRQDRGWNARSPSNKR
jgi:hypothetical protein